MNKIFSSASKLVFLLVAITMCASFLGIVFSNLSNEQIGVAVIAIASSAIGSAFTYYFTKKDGPAV